MYKKIFTFILYNLLNLLLLTSCSTKKESKYIPIGAVYPLTGEDSKIGIRAYNGLNMAVKEINKNGGVLGKKMDVIVLDDEGDEDKVLERYNELKTMGVLAIVGSSYSNVTTALAKVSVSDNMPIITPTATNPEVTIGRQNVFRACFIDDYQSKVMSKVAIENLHAKTAIIFKNSNESGYAQMADSFKYEFEQKGGQVISLEEYTTDILSFKTILRKYLENKPDVIFIPDDYTVGAKIINEAFELGFTDVEFLGIDSWESITDIIFDKDILSNILYSLYFAKDDPDLKVQEFILNYYADFSDIPVADSAMSYDAAYILSDAINRANSTESKDIINALKSTNLKVISGQINYDKNNNPIAPNACIITFENGMRKTFTKISF